MEEKQERIVSHAGIPLDTLPEEHLAVEHSDIFDNLDNSIFIGNKPFLNYVTGVVMQFTAKKMSEVIVKARGKFISRAVDVAEVAAKRFLNNTIVVKDIVIGSEEFTNREGRNVRVSTIEISLVKKQ